MKILIDTNLIIAACVEDHDHHSQAIRVLEGVVLKQNQGFVSSHSLLEAYSSLTRLPVKFKLTSTSANFLITKNIFQHFRLIALDGSEYINLIEEMSRRSFEGGIVYDALILSCARKAKVDRLFTFNRNHFEQLKTSADKFSIISPI